jgi:hypothetical protein
MSEKRKDYDRTFDPEGSKLLDEDRSCSCHINPPCGVCEDKQKEEFN